RARIVGTRFELKFALTRANGNARETLWELKTPLRLQEMLPALAERGESLSRGAFRDLLKERAWGKAVRATRKSGEIPQLAESQIWEWNEIAVMGGLRRIHAEIREKGESPELLGALAVGYANLASLTEYYFSPAQKGFAARAMLYAERLIRR